MADPQAATPHPLLVASRQTAVGVEPLNRLVVENGDAVCLACRQGVVRLEEGKPDVMALLSDTYLSG